ncbi:MAG: alpha/beta hydrolase [Alphaproteobacteria bacterium]|nr:alpha/beta hydrolase [Alphaproteobacteria bacterium]
MNIVFCHGVMDPDEDWENRESTPIKNWAYWLQFKTEKDMDIITQIPFFPHAHALLMKYSEWEQIMDKQDINEDTILIGHSAGGGFILKYMAQHPKLKIRQIILVAPWIDVENVCPSGFYHNMNLSDNLITRTKHGIDLLISADDDNDILNSVNKITKNLSDVRAHKFTGRGHFTGDELPEIMSIIKW